VQLTDLDARQCFHELDRARVYRPRLVGHLVAAYAASAAVESRSYRTALGGRNPCRSISHVALGVSRKSSSASRSSSTVSKVRTSFAGIWVTA
jgi:hypothetical protein